MATDQIMKLKTIGVKIEDTKLPSNPISEVRTVGELLKFALVEHPHFTAALCMMIPLELVFIALNCFHWGIYNDFNWHVWTKPAPMVVVIALSIVFMVVYGVNKFRAYTLAGFVLSLIADVILLGDADEHFLGGLVVFLLAHIMYIIAFSIPSAPDAPPVPMNFSRAKYFVAIGVIIPAILTSKMIANGTSMVLVGAVVLYSSVIATMGWRAAARIGYPLETKTSQIIAFIGSVFFIISDSILAFNRFHTEVPGEKIWVLTTYWIAQTLFAISLQRMPWTARQVLKKVQDIVN